MGEARSESVIAIDLGGTKIEAALVAPTGEIGVRQRIPTRAEEGPARVVDRLWSAIDGLLGKAQVRGHQLRGICVGAAGPIDMEKGLVTTAPNLPGWQSVPLRTMVRERYQTDAFLINDAKAAALGEHRFGAAKGVDNFVCVTLGTGIGGGIFINGHLYLGESGAAGEIGHMTVDIYGPKCVCGNVGCWECLASGTAMEREMKRRLAQGEPSSLSGASGIAAPQIAAAARQGDPLALEVLKWCAGNVGVGLVNLVNIFNPRMIVIGGGLAKIGAPLLEPAVQLVRSRAFPLHAQAVSIVPSALGDDMGILGCAAFAFQKGKL